MNDASVLLLLRSLILLAAVQLVVAGGSVHAAAEREAPGWSPPREADLPEGFPAGAQPGRVLVKWYPAARGAFLRLDGDVGRASFRGFWPLFRHIRNRGIEMTAPVVSEYGDDVRAADRGEMEMGFLYPNPRLGDPDPRDRSEVRVLDAPPRCVVSVGVEGPYDLATLRRGLGLLDVWLLENGGTWRASGPPRRLSYQQPLPFKRLYSEVQIPLVQQPLRP